MSLFWTDDRERTLRDLWPTTSASKLAVRIGAGCTRNMVIGKAQRLARGVKTRRASTVKRYKLRRLPRHVILVECDGHP
jgi:hypothetical protein